jgi:hypothetical protein
LLVVLRLKQQRALVAQRRIPPPRAPRAEKPAEPPVLQQRGLVPLALRAPHPSPRLAPQELRVSSLPRVVRALLPNASAPEAARAEGEEAAEVPAAHRRRATG